jgi:hypothetical protein
MGIAYNCSAATVLATFERKEATMPREDEPVIWKNPSHLTIGPIGDLRALLTKDDLFVWRRPSFSHADFMRGKGVTGLRLRFYGGRLLVHDEIIADPDRFPWVYMNANGDPGEGELDADALDIEERRAVVAAYLQGNRWLKAVYPNGFAIQPYM